jgi:hypothetical protein
MAFPNAPGHPGMSGTFIPTVFSKKAIRKFYNATVMAAISNTEYEGEIRNHGDKVVIPLIPDIQIKAYAKGVNLQYDSPESEAIELLIDQGRYWSFKTNDVDKAQSHLDFWNKWTDDAASQLKISVDAHLLANTVLGAGALNIGNSAGRKSGNIELGAAGTPLDIDKSNVLDIIVDAGTVLDEQNVPEEDRWLVLPPWACGMIKKSDLRDASLSGDGKSILRNGRVGMIDRFTIYCSNQLPIGADAGAMSMPFGHKYGMTFAAQLTKTESLRNQNDFGDLHRGLIVYGMKVIKPAAVGVLYAKKAAA